MKTLLQKDEWPDFQHRVIPKHQMATTPSSDWHKVPRDMWPLAEEGYCHFPTPCPQLQSQDVVSQIMSGFDGTRNSHRTPLSHGRFWRWNFPSVSNTQDKVGRSKFRVKVRVKIIVWVMIWITGKIHRIYNMELYLETCTLAWRLLRESTQYTNGTESTQNGHTLFGGSGWETLQWMKNSERDPRRLRTVDPEVEWRRMQ